VTSATPLDDFCKKIAALPKKHGDRYADTTVDKLTQTRRMTRCMAIAICEITRLKKQWTLREVSSRNLCQSYTHILMKFDDTSVDAT